MRLTKGKGFGMPMGGRLKHGQGGEIGGFPEMAKRPPKKHGKIANDVAEFGLRSAVMPAPTSDTREPYRSKAHVTTSPSNTISKGVGRLRGTPRGHVSKTPRCD
jgi:hypothetical protein